MTMHDQDATDRLLHCIQSKLDLIERLFELTCQQMEHLDSTEVERLISVLGHKQSVFDQLEELRSDLEPLMSVDPDERSWSSEGKRLECRDLVNRCGSKMQQILSMEEQSLGKLVERKQLISDQLTSLATASRMDVAYSQQRHLNNASSLDLSNG